MASLIQEKVVVNGKKCPGSRAPANVDVEPARCSLLLQATTSKAIVMLRNVRVTMRYSGTSEARTSINNVKSHSNVEKCESKAEEYEKEEDEEMVD